MKPSSVRSSMDEEGGGIISFPPEVRTKREGGLEGLSVGPGLPLLPLQTPNPHLPSPCSPGRGCDENVTWIFFLSYFLRSSSRFFYFSTYTYLNFHKLIKARKCCYRDPLQASPVSAVQLSGGCVSCSPSSSPPSSRVPHPLSIQRRRCESNSPQNPKKMKQPKKKKSSTSSARLFRP